MSRFTIFPLFVIYLCIQTTTTSAFVPISNHNVIRINGRQSNRLNFYSSSDSDVTMFARKKNISSEESKQKVDYGKIALMLVNPVNPYSWCVYFIAFIYLNAAMQ